MVNKKKEIDDFAALSEKDLWCQDLDAFMAVWEARLAEDSEITKKIRGMGRRASKKIGAGKGGKAQSRLKAADDDYAPKAPKVQKANPAKGVVKVEPEKSSQNFMSMFNAKPKPVSKDGQFGSDGAEELSGLSDDDFAAVAGTKPAVKTAPMTSRAPSEQPVTGRGKRAAAAKPKNWIVEDDESNSDDDKLLGDVGDMVKGIGMSSLDTGAGNGRVSLFTMSRPDSGSGRPSSSSGLPKSKPKSKTVIDLSDNDETNYEMLAQTSPQKTAPPSKELDSFLSDDDDLPVVRKKAPAPKPAPRPKKAPVPKKTAASSSSAAPKPVTLSPAAKAYALKQTKMKLQPAKKKANLSDSDDGDGDDGIEIAEPDSPPPRAAARGRPARAATAKPKKMTYDSDDDTDADELDASVIVDEDESEEFDDSD
jgi:DNA topoisomerase-2